MKKIRKESLLLLTACVHPKGMSQTVLQDGNVRLQQYIEAIRFYLDQYDFKVLVVENTNTDLSMYFSEKIKTERLECLTFNGNDFDRSLGKGYGEGLIINYAFLHSRLLKEHNYIIKVSGRHKVLNLNSIIKVSECFLKSNNNLAICEINKEKLFARSDCYIASKSFYENYLIEGLKECDDSQKKWFEHILYSCINKAERDGYQFLFLPFALDQRGVSGTSGNSIRRTRLRRKLHFFIKMIMYKTGIKKC